MAQDDARTVQQSVPAVPAAAPSGSEPDPPVLPQKTSSKTKALVLAALVVGALALGGILFIIVAKSEGPGASNSAVSDGTTNREDSVDATDARFLSILHETDSSYAESGSDADLLVLAQAACDHVEDGGSDYTAALVLMDSGGFSTEDAGFFVGLALAAYCPELN